MKNLFNISDNKTKEKPYFCYFKSKTVWSVSFCANSAATKYGSVNKA